MDLAQGDIQFDLPHIRCIAAQFDLPEPQEVDDFAEKGNINRHTYLVRAGAGEYLLQRINHTVFTRRSRSSSSNPTVTGGLPA